MKTVIPKLQINSKDEPLDRLFDALKAKAESDIFIQKAIEQCIEDLGRCDDGDDSDHGEFIGSVSDQDLIELLAEKIFLEIVIEACESKISRAKWRLKTVSNRFKQMVCDRFDLPDDEPIKVDLESMKVLKGDREARIEHLKNEVETILKADAEELKEFHNKEGTLEGDLADLIMGGHRENTVKLCDEIFKATQKDREFLEKVIDDEDVPKPIRIIADFVWKERGIGCRKKKIIEWR